MIEIVPCRIARSSADRDGGYCMDDNIATVANSFGRGYELMFTGSSNLSYVSMFNQYGSVPNNHLVRSIEEAVGEKKVYYLRKFHGIGLEAVCWQDVAQVKELMLEELAHNKPFVIFADAYWVPWDWGYQNYHTAGHAFIVTSIDDAVGELICADGYFGKVNARIPWKNVQIAYCGHMTFDLLDDYVQPSPEQVLECFLSEMSENGSMYGKLDRHLAVVLDDLFQRDIAPGDIWNEYAFQILNITLQTKMGFWIAAERVSALHPDYTTYLSSLAKEVERIAASWVAIKNTLLKMMIIKKKGGLRLQIAKALEEVLERESRLIRRYAAFGEGNREALSFSSTNVQQEATTVGGAIWQLNVTPYMNNTAFYEESEPMRADFTGSGQFFWRHGLPADGILTVDDVKFRFLDVNKEGRDNISCRGQLIRTAAERFTRLFVIGCAEYGDYNGRFELHYDDGTIEQMDVHFDDWRRKRPITNETIAWAGEFAERKEGATVTAQTPNYIYLYRCSLNDRKVLLAIRLPHLPEIHIFAVSVQKLAEQSTEGGIAG